MIFSAAWTAIGRPISDSSALAIERTSNARPYGRHMLRTYRRGGGLSPPGSSILFHFERFSEFAGSMNPPNLFLYFTFAARATARVAPTATAERWRLSPPRGPWLPLRGGAGKRRVTLRRLTEGATPPPHRAALWSPSSIFRVGRDPLIAPLSPPPFLGRLFLRLTSCHSPVVMLYYCHLKTIGRIDP